MLSALQRRTTFGYLTLDVQPTRGPSPLLFPRALAWLILLRVRGLMEIPALATLESAT